MFTEKSGIDRIEILANGFIQIRRADKVMKDGVVIINTSRGGNIVEEDLIEALKSGKVFGAGLDVFRNEPNPRKDLIELDNVVSMPHMGSQTVETQDALAVLTAERVIEVLQG